MKTNLNITIKTREQAKAFLSELHKNGESYHPDDCAHDIIFSEESEVSDDDRTNLDNLMDQVFEVPDFDPYSFLLELSGLQ